MTTNLFSRLSRDFGELLESSFNYDVIIQVGELPHVVEFHVHSIILATRSPYFRSALSDKWATKQENELSEILEFFIASDELLLDEIMSYIQEYLLKNDEIWTTKNSVKISRILPDCSVSAIFQNSSYGPTFGYPDLFISSNCNQTNSSDCNCNHYYEKNFSVTDFFVEDYEVFQIISKH
ncbi:16414_t:CDS:2 [Cetraspora pellucida]|uniref:16414_t:CDS:1 n=1 Tax=Cetraspora pellucida TaxID=1433469 RepID=A0A9N9CH20_9GLOM|nr:16414_t:CDS:2 [Cetraspora pellucida]